jgi:HD-GYP domain-containing protein (c-di-GMP phosphodiesterase class II)
VVKMHARVGAEIVGTLPTSELLQGAVEHHHESFDGTGYPGNLQGEQIPLWARILAVADAYVNMTTARSFAAAKSSGQALVELESLSGVRYDGMLVRILLHQLKTERAPSSFGN